MGVMKGFKNLFIGEDDSDQIEYQTGYGSAREESRGTQTSQSYGGYGSYGSYNDRSEDRDYISSSSASRQSYDRSSFERPTYSRKETTSYTKNYQESERQMNVEHMQTLQIVLARPVDFSEVREIGDDINEFKTVILNLEMVKSDDAKRILDFLSGVAYANKAQIKMMAQKTFAIMSKNVKFDGRDLMTELENNGYSF